MGKPRHRAVDVLGLQHQSGRRGSRASRYTTQESIGNGRSRYRTQEILHPGIFPNAQYGEEPMPSTKPILKLLDLIQSHRVTAVIYVAAKLGIAELLRDGPRAPDELAKVTGADTGALGRLLTALSTLGICSPAGEDRYSLTELGAGLDGDAEHSFKHWAIFEGQLLSKSWNGMLESIMTGKTAAQILNVANSFDLMARTPENVSMFNAAMTDLTRLVTPDVLRAYDFG